MSLLESNYFMPGPYLLRIESGFGLRQNSRQFKAIHFMWDTILTLLEMRGRILKAWASMKDWKLLSWTENLVCLFFFSFFESLTFRTPWEILQYASSTYQHIFMLSRWISLQSALFFRDMHGYVIPHQSCKIFRFWVKWMHRHISVKWKWQWQLSFVIEKSMCCPCPL